jgi:hypothetical protein
MNRPAFTFGLAALLAGPGFAYLNPAQAQGRNPCLGDGFSTQAEIDRRCAAAHGRAGGYADGYQRRPSYEPRYERRSRFRDDYGYQRRWRDEDDD